MKLRHSLFGSDASYGIDSVKRKPVTKTISEPLRRIITDTIDTLRNPTGPMLVSHLIEQGHNAKAVSDTFEDMVESGSFRIYRDFRLFNR